MSNLSFKTRANDFTVDSINSRYDVSGYNDLNGRVTFSLSYPQKIIQLEAELNSSASVRPKNEMAAKTLNDIARARKAELLLLQSGFDVVLQNDEIEISSTLKSEEDIDLVAEYFKIYVADILGGQGVVEDYD